MLRALLFAALFAAVLAVVYTKSTSAEDVIKKLDANQEKLDQLNARIQNLKNKLKARVAAREEADRKSKNMLLRLDRMDIKDGSYHCHKSTDGRQTNFKCRTGQQCVPNILVCDNKVDCEDGSDEDEDFCSFPGKSLEGKTHPGFVFFSTCVPLEASHFTITWDSVERAESLPSVLNIKSTGYFEYNAGIGIKQTASFPVNFHYMFGALSGFHIDIFDAVTFKGILRLMPGEDVIHYDIYKTSTNEICEKDIIYLH